MTLNEEKNVMKILKKLTIISSLILLLTIICNYSFIDDLLMRDTYFKKYTKSDQQIYFLGTDHTMSLTSSPFSYLELKAVIENLKPDVLLVESRPEQLSNDNLGDGPIEMLYSNLIARNINIPVKGVDWWDENIDAPNSTDSIRDNHIDDNILKNATGYKKVLILMGRKHLVMEGPKLKISGYREDFFSIIDKEKLFRIHDKKLVYPKGMEYYVKRRIAYEEYCVNNVYKTKAFKDEAKEVIYEFSEFSKTVGQTGETQ